MTQCSIDGCTGTAKARGWCQAHYMRWRTTGDTGPALVVRRQAGRTCSVDGCTRPHSGRGFCGTHLRRFNLYGDPGPAEIEARNPGAVCKIDGCARPAEGRGWCNAHYLRWRATGDPLTPLLEHAPAWRGDAVGYSGLHRRLRKARGRVSELVCVECGNPAQHWAYDHADPDEKFDAQRGLPFSTDLDRYQPMCQPCHRRFDVAHLPPKHCAVPGCSAPYKAKGYCERHYRTPPTADSAL